MHIMYVINRSRKLKETRNQKSARNVIYGIWKQVILLALNFFAKTVFIKVMGKEYLGLNGIFNNMFLMFSFAEFGIGTAMVYSFYEPFSKNNQKKCAALYQYFKKMYILLSFGILLCGVLLVPLLPYIINLDISIEKIIVYYLLYMLSCFFSNFFLCQANLLVADQNQYIVTKIQLILESITFLVQIVVILVWKSFFLYISTIIVKFILMGLLYTLKIRQKYAYITKKTSQISQTEKKNIINNVKDLLLYKFSKTLINSSDNVIISIIVGTIWVGMYSNYEFVITGVWGIVTAFFSAISASVGNLLVEKGKEQQYKVYCIIEMVNVWISGFTSICLIVLFQDFISMWAGQSYKLDITVVLIIVLNYYLRCMREGLSMFREAAGMFKRFKNITLITASLNIVLSFALGYFWGLKGVFGATAISVLVTYFWYEPYLVYKDLFSISVKPYFIRQLKNISVTFCLCGATFYLCTWIHNDGIIGFVFKCIICTIVPNLFYLVYFRKTEQFIYLYQMGVDLLGKWRRKNER